MKTNLNFTNSPAEPYKSIRSIILIVCLIALSISAVQAQTLTDGGNHDGTILLNQTNSWTFTATNGDNIVLRGAALTATNNFNPWLRIYNPNGILIADSGANDGNMTVEELALTATNSGTFTALINDSGFGNFSGTGAYRLYFAHFPGTFIVPAGDEGGPLTNGGNYDGTIQLGDLDLWSFTANAGDRFVLRMGALTNTNNFNPWLRIYGPDGALIGDSGANDGNMTAEELALTATNSGTYTVLVSDSGFGFFGGTGTYRLYFAQFPEAFTVPAGDEGGPLTNGGNYDGTIQLGDLDLWSFTANAGDRFVLRMGALTNTNNFNPWLRIYGPDGALIGDSGVNDSNMTAEELALTATNSGTYTVLVSDSGFGFFGGTGTYRLYFAQFPEAFTVPAGDEGGALTNGGNHDGTIQLGDLDLWSFTANAGDRFVLRMGALTNTNNFNPWLRIYGPNGVLIGDSGVNDSNMTAEELALTATNSGTYTVLVSDSGFGFFGGTGTYRLYFAQFPEAFTVPAGDEGGALTNGGNHDGTIQLGDLDLWSFTANAGDRFVLRMGALTNTNNFNPWLRIYGPNGVLIGDSGVNDSNMTAEELALTATNSGTYTVLVSDSGFGFFGGTGTYRLYFAQFPGAFVVPAGDEGGSLSTGVNPVGTIQVGDLDLWRFTACAGDFITLTMDQLTATNNFNPWIRLYGPDGVLIADSGSLNGNLTQTLTLTATNSGEFTVLLSDSGFGGFGGTGTYRLSSDGLYDGLKFCIPRISSTNLFLSAINGPTNGNVVIYSTTNVANPFALWSPMPTNKFDQFGVLNVTNLYNPSIPRQFFRLVFP